MAEDCHRYLDTLMENIPTDIQVMESGNSTLTIMTALAGSADKPLISARWTAKHELSDNGDTVDDPQVKPFFAVLQDCDHSLSSIEYKNLEQHHGRWLDSAPASVSLLMPIDDRITALHLPHLPLPAPDVVDAPPPLPPPAHDPPESQEAGLAGPGEVAAAAGPGPAGPATPPAAAPALGAIPIADLPGPVGLAAGAVVAPHWSEDKDWRDWHNAGGLFSGKVFRFGLTAADLRNSSKYSLWWANAAANHVLCDICYWIGSIGTTVPAEGSTVWLCPTKHRNLGRLWKCQVWKCQVGNAKLQVRICDPFDFAPSTEVIGAAWRDLQLRADEKLGVYSAKLNWQSSNMAELREHTAHLLSEILRAKYTPPPRNNARKQAGQSAAKKRSSTPTNGRRRRSKAPEAPAPGGVADPGADPAQVGASEVDDADDAYDIEGAEAAELAEMALDADVHLGGLDPQEVVDALSEALHLGLAESEVPPTPEPEPGAHVGPLGEAGEAPAAAPTVPTVPTVASDEVRQRWFKSARLSLEALDERRSAWRNVHDFAYSSDCHRAGHNAVWSMRDRMNMCLLDAFGSIFFLQWSSNTKSGAPNEVLLNMRERVVARGCGQRVRIDALQRYTFPIEAWDPKWDVSTATIISPDIGVSIDRRPKSKRVPCKPWAERLQAMTTLSLSTPVAVLDSACFICGGAVDVRQATTCAFCVLTSHKECAAAVRNSCGQPRCTDGINMCELIPPSKFGLHNMCAICLLL